MNREESIKHGRWKQKLLGTYCGLECSLCNWIQTLEPEELTYCPHCGAIMDGELNAQKET